MKTRKRKTQSQKMRDRLADRKQGHPIWMSVRDTATYFQVPDHLIYQMRNEGQFYVKHGDTGILLDIVNPIAPEPVAKINASVDPEEAQKTFLIRLEFQESNALQKLAEKECRSSTQQIKWLIRCALKKEDGCQ